MEMEGEKREEEMGELKQIILGLREEMEVASGNIF